MKFFGQATEAVDVAVMSSAEGGNFCDFRSHFRSTCSTGNNFYIQARLQFHQHGGRSERPSLIDRPNSHFIIIMAGCCFTRILHGARQATQAPQKYKFSSISKRQDGKHLLVRAGKNVMCSHHVTGCVSGQPAFSLKTFFGEN